MKTIRNFLLPLIIVILSAGAGFAKDIKFEANLDRNRVALGESCQLGLTFYGTRDMSAPDIGNIDGLEIRYLGPSTMMTVINGRVSSSITHMYTILPLKTGKFQLGPFSFKHRGDSYTSNVAFLEATEEAPYKEEREEALGGVDLEDRIFLTLSAGKRSAYTNELVPVTVKLYVNRLNVRDIQLPTFEEEGFSKVEFKEPKQYREEVSGLIYDVLEFKTNIFGTRPGDYKLGPAKLKCNLIVRKKLPRRPSRIDDFFEDEFFSRDSFFDDFFTHYERYPIELKSQGISLIVSPLPSEGRPKDFSGAIGDYQFIFSANPKKVKVGDPITLNMEINGTGNFNTVLIPKLEGLDGFKVYEPQVKTEPNRKMFTQVLIPETDRVTQTPRAVFNYFDADRKEYKRIEQGPIPIEVEKGKEEPPSQVVGPALSLAPMPSAGPESIGRDIIYIKDSPGRLVMIGRKIYKNKIFLFLLFIPFLFLVSLSIVQGIKERLRQDTRYSRRLRAPKRAKKTLKTLKQIMRPDDPAPFYEALFEALQEYMGDRFDIQKAGITYDVIDSFLKEREGIDLGMIRKIKNLFEACDKARFGLTFSDEFKMRDDLKEFEETIRYFERLKI